MAIVTCAPCISSVLTPAALGAVGIKAAKTLSKKKSKNKKKNSKKMKGGKKSKRIINTFKF